MLSDIAALSYSSWQNTDDCKSSVGFFILSDCTESHKHLYIFLCVAVLHCYEMAQNQRMQLVLSYGLSVITFRSRIYYYLRMGSRTASSLTTKLQAATHLESCYSSLAGLHHVPGQYLRCAANH